VVETLQSVVIIALVWALTARYGLIGAALAWLPGVAAALILSVYYLRRVLTISLLKLARPLLAILLVTSIGAGSAFFIDNLNFGLVTFLSAVLVALIGIFTLYWTLDKQFKIGFIESGKQLFPQIFSLIRLLREKETISA
jgi:O-antigen/teichoic acid export membrane protein